jgi:hypothetical protein
MVPGGMDDPFTFKTGLGHTYRGETQPRDRLLVADGALALQSVRAGRRRERHLGSRPFLGRLSYLQRRAVSRLLLSVGHARQQGFREHRVGNIEGRPEFYKASCEPAHVVGAENMSF